MANKICNQNSDEISMKIFSSFSICMEKEDEVWYKTLNLYRTAADNPTTNNSKRQILLQLAEDVKNHYAKTKEQAMVCQESSSQSIIKASKRKAQISENNSNRKFMLFRIIPRWLAIIIEISVIFAVVLILLWVILTKPPSNYTQNYHDISVRTSHSIEINEKNRFLLKDWFNESFSATIIRSTNINRDKYNEFWIVLTCLVLFIFYFIISKCVRIQKIIIYIWCLRNMPSEDLTSSLINRRQKIILLDPMEQHSNLYSLCRDSLLVYTSVNDCFHGLSDPLIEYILFLPLTTYEVHSSEFDRLSNLSLYIFYEDNNQSHPQIPKIKYRIRFIFPISRLSEHLLHAIILNYAKLAYMYRVQCLESEADKNYQAAIHHCDMLMEILKQQLVTIPGSPPDDSLPRDGENMNDSYLRSFTFLPEH